MGKARKVLEKVLSGTADANVRFSDLRMLLVKLDFSEHIRGDHFLYSREGIVDIINIQPIGSMSKSYQVKQVRGIITKYKLGGDL